MRRATVLALVVLLSGWAVGDVLAGERVSTTFPMPVRLNAVVEMSGCKNAPGPYVTLGGDLGLGGFSADLIFRNNLRGTLEATEETEVNIVILPNGESLSIPKQPVEGGTGGNPFIWIQILDENNKAITEEIFLGRCVQGLTQMSADFFLNATGAADVTVGDCSHNGPFLTLSGEVALSGINARLIFSNNDNKVGGPHRTDRPTKIDIVLLPEGESITLPKQPVLGGVGGNPWIFVQFKDGNQDPIGREFQLGRCVQLSK